VKIKLDENLPERPAQELAALGHDVDTVRAEHLAGRPDNEIWQAAQSVDRFLITQDLDFSDVRRYTPGTHGGLLLVRSRSPVEMLSSPGWSCCSRRSRSINGLDASS
jgi:predicted nuclease of predicted toxin-antitoxin system